MYRTSTYLMFLIALLILMQVGVVSGYNPANDPSLVAWWGLNEGSGTTAADASANGNDGTLTGATWASGKSGSGIYFDGVNGYLSVPNVLSAQGTIAFWFKPDWNGTDPEDYRIFDGSLGAIYFFISKGADDANVDPADFGFYFEDSTDADYQNVEFDPAGVIFADTWFHIVVTWEFGGGSAVLYFNGVEMARTNNLGAFPALNGNPRFGLDIANYLPSTNGAMGVIDEILIFDRALSSDEAPDVMNVAAELASNPSPGDAAVDVPRDNLTLGWTSGEFAATHDVYFGTNFDDVNDATRSNPLGVLANQSQVAASFSLGRLDLGQTYFWRIDEVNAAPDNTIFSGAVWSFTVEPVSYPIPASNISATASGSTGDPNSPNRTIDGSGLNENDQHSTDDADIWLSSVGADPTWIQYEFDKPYKLDKMLVWNGNSLVETAIGWGFKDITLETSLDGVTWTVVDGVTQLTQATSQDDYGPGDTIELNNITAKYVRITVLSNWGGILPQYALSEVRVYFFPTYAREPQPDSGTNVVPPVLAGWRAGREAADHTLSLDTDANAVMNGTAVSQTVQIATHDLGSFGLLLGETYYWQVNETNDAMDPANWPGDLWSFSISDPLVVDDFEVYTNQSPRRPFQTWIDGLGYSANDFLPGDPGNNTGAAVGHDIFSIQSPYESIMELTLIHGGSQSLPLYYDNSGTGGKLTYSEMTRTITTNQDWTQYGISTLVLYFRGMEGNTGQLYVKINNTKVLYTEDAAALSRPLWQQWNIDLSSIGGNVSNVQSFTVGIEGAGSGLVYVDDVLLYRDAPPVPVPVDPGNAGLVAAYSMENNVNDGSGQGRNATAIGNPNYAAGPTGLGSALSFDGLEDYVDLPIGSVISSATDMTIVCWVDFADSGGAWQRIFDFGTGTTNYMFLTPAVNVSDAMRFAITTGGSASESLVNAPFALPTGWHHVSVTIDSATMSLSLFMDGSVVGSGPTEWLPQDLGETTQNWLGRSQFTADAFFEGALDEVLIYDRALSIPEVRYLAGDR